MSFDAIIHDPAVGTELDTKDYSVDADELEFFQKLTGIQDEEELKAHVVRVQVKAYQVHAYNCIRRFTFLKLKIARIPAYKHALKLLEERVHNNPIFLDIGCCFGNDIRKVVLDGWPVQNVIASDLQQKFWDCGHDLFMSTPETFPAAFVAGSVFDTDLIKPREPFVGEEEIEAAMNSPTPQLNALTSLTPLQGKISALHASSFFHLFSEDEQLTVARRLASLLSPQKGSIIFGQHSSRPVKGFRTEASISIGRLDSSGKRRAMFCHSPESWKELWLKDVFGGADKQADNIIKVDAELVEVNRKYLAGHTVATDDTKFYFIIWSVTRL